MKKILYITVVLLCIAPIGSYVLADEESSTENKSTISENSEETQPVSEGEEPSADTSKSSQAAQEQQTAPTEAATQPEVSAEIGESIDEWMPDPYMQQAAMEALGVDSPDKITKLALSRVDRFDIDPRVQTLKGIEYAEPRGYLTINFKGTVTEGFHPDFSALYNTASTRKVFISVYDSELMNIDQVFGEVFTNIPGVVVLIGGGSPTLFTEELTADDYQSFSIPISSFYIPVHYFTYETYPGENDDFWAQHSGETVEQVPVPVDVYGRYIYVNVGGHNLIYRGEVDVSNEQVTFELVNKVDYADIAGLTATSTTITFQHGLSYGVEGTALAAASGVTEQAGYTVDKDLIFQLQFAEEEDLTTVSAHDSTIYVGDEWGPADNFDSATNQTGDPVDFSQVSVQGAVDTEKAGTYSITYQYGAASSTITVTVKPDLTSVTAHDSTLSIGDNWTPADNFDQATDRDGAPVSLDKVNVSGQVDTEKAGRYPVTYQNGSAATTIYVTVAEEAATEFDNHTSPSSAVQTSHGTLPQTGDTSSAPLVALGLSLLLLYRLKK